MENIINLDVILLSKIHIFKGTYAHSFSYVSRMRFVLSPSFAWENLLPKAQARN